MKKVCINKEPWIVYGRSPAGPKFNDIVTVTGGIQYEGHYYYMLKEYDNCAFLASKFADVLPDSVIEQLMRESEVGICGM